MTEPDSSARVAAVRGAVQVAENTADAIRASTARLLVRLLEVNRLDPSEVVSAIFTATPDLDADFPAHAARRLGWTDVPLLGAREMAVPGALPRVIRVLLTVWRAGPSRLEPVYLDGAEALRPDLTGAETAGTVAAKAAEALAPGGARPRVALLGLGQMGGSIALALGRGGRWWRAGYDPSAVARAEAQRGGALEEACESVGAACTGAALAIAAAPVDALPGLIAAAAAALPTGAALLDVGSARGGVTEALEHAAQHGIAAVGGHPLAGTEGHGFAAASADRFDGATFCVLPAGGEVPEPVFRLLEDLGARPLVVTPDEHDRALARTSHLPYVVACALRDLGGEAAARGLSGPGFRDMTRLAGSDPRMANAYCAANAAEVASAWRELRALVDRRVGDLTAASR